MAGSERQDESLTVGALAKRAGISVRTLHYYDEIGLLSPSERRPSGRRYYATADVARLQQILSLRQLGFPLEDIGRMLASADYTLRRVLELHVERLRAALDEQRKLVHRLERVIQAIGRSGLPPLDELLLALEDLAQSEKYFTPEQREKIAERARSMGEAAIRKGERDWAKLLDDVRAAMAAKADPRGARAKKLAARWQDLLRQFTGGDAGIQRSLNARWSNEKSVHGIRTDGIRAMAEYLSPAFAQLNAERAKRESR